MRLWKFVALLFVAVHCRGGSGSQGGLGSSKLANPAADLRHVSMPAGGQGFPDPFVGTGSVVHDLDGQPNDGKELLLMTHTRLMWYNPYTRTTRVLLQQSPRVVTDSVGVSSMELCLFRGVFRNNKGFLVVLTTPKMHKHSQSSFFEVDSATGTVLNKTVAEGTFAGHEMVSITLYRG